MKKLKVINYKIVIVFVWIATFLGLLAIQYWQYLVDINILNLTSLNYWMILVGLILFSTLYKKYNHQILWASVIQYFVAVVLNILGFTNVSEVIFRIGSVFLLFGLIRQILV